MIVALSVGLILLYMFFDVHYYLRVAFTIGLGRIFNKKTKVSDVHTIYGFCTTQDVDIFLGHMNNARYVREVDFARFHFYDRTGILPKVTAVKGNLLLGASNIRYRRSIAIFTAYKIETKLVYWDENALYFEQKFITLRDGFVRAVILSKQISVGITVDAILKGLRGADEKPPFQPELKHWLESIEILSAKLRK